MIVYNADDINLIWLEFSGTCSAKYIQMKFGSLFLFNWVQTSAACTYKCWNTLIASVAWMISPRWRFTVFYNVEKVLPYLWSNCSAHQKCFLSLFHYVTFANSTKTYGSVNGSTRKISNKIWLEPHFELSFSNAPVEVYNPFNYDFRQLSLMRRSHVNENPKANTKSHKNVVCIN